MLSKENTEFTQGFIAKIFSDCKNLSSVALGQCDVKTSTRLLLLSWKLFMLILEGSKKVKIKINIGKVKVNINSDWFLCHPPPPPPPHHHIKSKFWPEEIGLNLGTKFNQQIWFIIWCNTGANIWSQICPWIWPKILLSHMLQLGLSW